MATPRKANPSRGGRPTEYRDGAKGHARQAFKLALLGLNEEHIADVLGINKATLTRWKKSHPEFCASLTRGKAPADAEVAASMYERACGYSHPAVEFFYQPGHYEESGEGDAKVRSWVPGHVVRQRYTKHYAPETKAASVWLFNRQRMLWRNRVELEHFDRRPLEDLTDAELETALGAGGGPTGLPGRADDPSGAE